METAKLDNFFIGIRSYLDAQADARKAYNSEVALEFNPMLQFFHIGENKFSELVAYFLNPQEKHGQGSIFLKAFIALGELPCKAWADFDLETAKIYREHPVNGRRIDLYIHFPETGYAIGIEMKIWASDQLNQLQDYHSWLQKHHGEKQCLIYWNPYGHEATESSISKEQRLKLESVQKYCKLTHEEHTVALLESWISVCRAENVRTFLKQLLQFINHEINGERFMGQHELIARYLKENPAFLKQSLDIINAQDAIRNFITEDFRKAWTVYNWPKGIEPDNSESFTWNETYASLSYIITIGDYPFKVALEWERANFREGYVGFVMKEGSSTENEKAAFESHFGAQKKTDGWPWYKLLPNSLSALQIGDLIGSNRDAVLRDMATTLEDLLNKLGTMPAYQ